MRAAILILVAVGSTAPGIAQQSLERPNVVLIMTDDVGYGDIGSYGAPDVETPNLDALAREGVRFTDFYANGPLCTPTRVGLVTGRYQQRVALERPLGTPADLEVGLPATGRSLPQLLKTNGYATGLVGKWHLGWKDEYSPNAHGFDYFFGFKSGYIDYYTHTNGAGEPDLFENNRTVEVAGYMTDLITQRSVRFIEQNAERPFFLSVQYNAGHWPYQPPDMPSVARDNARHLQPHDDDTASREDYVAMLERADEGIGEILDTLVDSGLAENTLIIFTNDNGGEWLSRNAPLFHRKLTLWEGGIRVPTIIRWPGRVPAGRVSHQVGITMDLTATILAATDTPAPADLSLEGINLLPILEGRTPEIERTLFWRTKVGGREQWAVRSGDWKLLIDGNATLLFDLNTDISERHDMASHR
jgi:arylsulfatase A-like enzyme